MKQFQKPVPRRQQGIVLFIALVALVVLLLSAVALIRSTDTALLLSGNIAVKQDMTNQAELAIVTAENQFSSTGLLSALAARNSNVPAANYSATMLASNAQGIPNILLDTTSNFTSSFSAPALTGGSNGLEYRYVIDRMCSRTGAPDARYCAASGSTLAGRSQTDWLENAQINTGGYIYRITVRVTDVKHAQSFIQTTVSI